MLFGPLLSLMDISSFSSERIILTIVQIILSILLLYSSMKFNENSRASIVRYEYVCYAIILYIMIFAIWFANNFIPTSDGSGAYSIMHILIVLIVSSPFLWCILNAKRLTKAISNKD